MRIIVTSLFSPAFTSAAMSGSAGQPLIQLERFVSILKADVLFRQDKQVPVFALPLFAVTATSLAAIADLMIAFQGHAQR